MVIRSLGKENPISIVLLRESVTLYSPPVLFVTGSEGPVI